MYVTIVGDYINKTKDGIFFKPLEDLNLIEEESLWHPIIMDFALFDKFNKKALSCVYPYIISKDFKKDRQYYHMPNFFPSLNSVLRRLTGYPSRIYIMGSNTLYREALKLHQRIRYHILVDKFEPRLVPSELTLLGWKPGDCYEIMHLERNKR